ncbi:MAG: hypothetical protein COB12_07720 [Flavobacterium sp.]|nr:MAG: hypothetical protein COB12_07720 [Flavobacterium sp.]
MKTRFLLFLFLLGAIKTQAQEYKGFTIDASFGISVPIGDYKSYTKTLGQENEFNLIGFTEEITGKTQFNLDAAYYFNNFGVGANFGIFNHEISSLTYEINFPVKTDGGDINGTYYGIGPNYTTSLGVFNFTGLVRGGLMNVSLDKFIGSYNGTDVSNPVEILNTEQSPGSKSSLPYASFGIKLSYPVYEGLSAFVTAEYLTSFGDGLEVLDTYVTPHDTNGDGSITSIDIDGFVNSDHLVEEIRFLKPQMLYFGLGLKYGFGDTAETSRKVLSDEEYKRKEGIKIAGDLDADSDGDGLSVEDFPEGIVFENANDKRKKDRLIAIFPKNNSNYNDANEINNFSWELGGNQIENPQYKFEIFKIGENQELQSVYVENTTKTRTLYKAAIQQKLEGSLDQFGEGHYKWSVTETTTGFTSNDNYFGISTCNFDFTISNETIECLSYDTDNRILKICFDSVFSSPSALVDLTFADLLSGSGLILYDQNINALVYNLVNPNPQLMPQSGTGGATLYCLEVTVPNSVTSVTIRLQGDVINASGGKCIPLAEFTFNDLPNCYCNDCDDKTLTLDNLTISSNGTNGNQYTISGNLTASTPIYGMEFQIQSIAYTANPSACTKGISSIEESGMFILPGTTINNSTSVRVYKETISGSSNTNNFATKTIQYKSISPITGSIPVNLNIGLPGPLQGLDASCCQIEYTVCIKAKIYLEDGNCKSCVFTHCFSFTNQ